MMTPLLSIQQRIHAACERSGRRSEEVRLVAVSKLQPLEKIDRLNQENQNDFGENYVQEFLPKSDARPSLNWHFIGHLQRNKVKMITGRCLLIHSVDSLELARMISKKAEEKNLSENILLQVNVGEEASKEGFSCENLLSQWNDLSKLSNIRIHGLMTMPPLQNEAEENRLHFRKLKQLLQSLPSAVLTHPLKELSMGTSHDFEVAIEEGATLIRVGTILFGERPQKTSEVS